MSIPSLSYSHKGATVNVHMCPERSSNVAQVQMEPFKANPYIAIIMLDRDLPGQEHCRLIDEAISELKSKSV